MPAHRGGARARAASSTFNPHARRLDAARVDYALVSRALDVEAADIDETPPHRFGSDHAPLWIDLQPQKFGGLEAR